MYLFTKAGRQLLRTRESARPVFPVLIIGLGPDAFIGPCAWFPNLEASGGFFIKYVAPSRNADKAAECVDDYGFDAENVSNDYQALVTKALDEEGVNLVVALSTETPYHFEQIDFCIRAGVKQIVMDKPPVVDWEEWCRIRALAKQFGCLLLVSYQHTMNAPTYEMRLKVAKHLALYGPDSIELSAFFKQDWLHQPPAIEGCRQVWRLDSKWCGLLDIGTHAADGASVIAGSPIKTVMSSTHSKARVAGLDKPALDNGQMEVVFANGLKAKVEYHQALTGHADDIGWIVKLRHPTGEIDSYMWRMELGPDTLWGAGKDADPLRLDKWEHYMRGHGSAISAESNSAFGLNPGGHVQGWSDMWKIFFLRCYRAILEHNGDSELAEQLVPVCQGYCPDFTLSGGNTMGFFDAAVRCFETGQACDVPTLDE